MAVGLFKIQPRIQSHQARRIKRFFCANFRRSARAHLAAGHFQHARAMAQRLQLDERPGHR